MAPDRPPRMLCVVCPADMETVIDGAWLCRRCAELYPRVGGHRESEDVPDDAPLRAVLIDPDTKMCRWCRDNWRPAGGRPGDLGYHGQPQPLAVARHGNGATGPARRRIRSFGTGMPKRWHSSRSGSYWSRPRSSGVYP